MSEKFSVIFDMDGTLLDTQKLFVPAWEHAGRVQGIEGAGKHVYNLCGMNDEGCRRYIRENMPMIDVERFRADMHEYIKENCVVKFRDGAEELLYFLKANGIKIGLASGSSREVVERNLGALDITDIFDAIVSGNEVQNGKPAPDIFLLAAKRMGVNSQSCIVFEDSPHGIQAGNVAGMKCIGYPDLIQFDEQTCDILLAQVTDLKDAIPILKNYL